MSDRPPPLCNKKKKTRKVTVRNKYTSEVCVHHDFMNCLLLLTLMTYFISVNIKNDLLYLDLVLEERTETDRLLSQVPVINGEDEYMI